MRNENRGALTEDAASSKDKDVTLKIFKNWISKASVVFNAAWDGFLITVGATTLTDLSIREFIKRPANSQQVLSFCGEYKPLVQSFIAGDTTDIFRNIAIMKGCNEGISFVMKNYFGAKDDVKTSMVAGFGYGVVISLVTGMKGPGVVSVGVVFALFNGGMFKTSPARGKAER